MATHARDERLVTRQRLAIAGGEPVIPPSAQPPEFDYLKRAVKMEFGSLTDQQPAGRHAVRPWIADIIPLAFADWKCDVVALELERTFWEKATILHSEFHRPVGTPTPDRFSRHYADTAALAAQSARQALVESGVGPDEIDMLLWASARASAHQHASTAADGGVLDEFCYAASWLQEELGLDRATVSGIAQQGCAGMFATLRLARALLVAEPQRRHVLCVGVDALPADFRVVFILRDVEGCSVEEAAAQLDIPQSTVKTRLFRARRRLRSALERQFAAGLDGIFPFLGARCDRICDEVLRRLD